MKLILCINYYPLQKKYIYLYYLLFIIIIYNNYNIGMNDIVQHIGQYKNTWLIRQINDGIVRKYIFLDAESYPY